MVKQSVSFMNLFFKREDLGTPQLFAGLLLLVFVAQCIWLIAQQPPGYVSADDLARVEEGSAQWQGHRIAGLPSGEQPPREWTWMRGSAEDPRHSPLWYLIEAAPVAVLRVSPDSSAWLWLTRAPYLLFGALLGASLWYVARRLYGNAGGYCALALYCFSPTMIRSCTLWFSPPNIAGAWGTFGAVFTAIAVSHTLYAPREVVLWNWRRIVLLGVSLALAIGSEFGLVVILPVLLLFMFYLAPNRRGAAVAIFAAALAVAALLLWGGYFFHPQPFLHGLIGAHYFTGATAAFRMSAAYRQIAREIVSSEPVLGRLAPVALAVYLGWPRCRYFGNTAPLLVILLFLALRVASPHGPESVFTVVAVAFLFVFVAGITADLLETKGSEFLTAIVAGLLAANALWSLVGLVRISR
jgi:hypothetical protein